MPSGGTLVVLGKEPVPGQVKTRMHPPLSLDEAAELYAALLADVLETSARACAALGLAPVFAVHPPEACARMVGGVPAGVRVVAQRGVSLAERMESAAAEAAASAPGPILLRGSDSPLLGEALLCEALEALALADVVLSPDLDGGYSLVGLRCPQPGLFAHAMSTAHVLRDTRTRAEARGLRVALLNEGFDLDSVADLQRLAEARDASTERECPRTLSFLDARGLWEMAGSG